MPEEPHLKVLDRDFSLTGARQLIELASPLLKEVVNHGTNVYIRCQAASSQIGDVDEDAAPFTLYRSVLEMTDGIEVLLSGCSVTPAIPILRTSFEASLYLEYVLQTDSKRRSLSWVYTYAEKKLRAYLMMRGSGQAGEEFFSAYRNRHNRNPPQGHDLDQSIAAMQSVLKKPHLAEVAAEFQRCETADGRRPEWYRLFDGPRKIRELAKRVNRLADYDFLYRYWSSFAHAHSLAHVTRLTEGGQGDKGLRYGGELLQACRASSGRWRSLGDTIPHGGTSIVAAATGQLHTATVKDLNPEPQGTLGFVL